MAIATHKNSICKAIARKGRISTIVSITSSGLNQGQLTELIAHYDRPPAVILALIEFPA